MLSSLTAVLEDTCNDPDDTGSVSFDLTWLIRTRRTSRWDTGKLGRRAKIRLHEQVLHAMAEHHSDPVASFGMHDAAEIH